MSGSNIILPEAFGSQTVSGAMGMDNVNDLRKALEAGYGTDVSQLTGGGALRVQSLERTLLSTIQENEHFMLFNDLTKTNATATVDEWTEQKGVGGFLGGSTNTETGDISEAQGDYARRVGLVKFLMSKRQISFVAGLQGSIASAEATEQQNGALQLLTDAEFLSFEGDEAVVPTEFSGVRAQLLASEYTDNVVDAEGEALDSIHLLNKGAQQIVGFGNFGTPTHLYLSVATQADLDNGLDPAFRVPLTNVPGGGVQLGAPVKGVRTSWGDIANRPDVFIRDEKMQKPFELLYPKIAAKNDFKPAAVATDATASAANSKFGAAHGGNYYYAVAGVNAKGQSRALVTTQVTVAAGKVVKLTIDASASGEETGYAIYRGRKDGTDALSDLRLVTRIPRTGAQTEWKDVNRLLPGSTTAYILNLKPGAQALNWRQLLPMLKFPLYPTSAAVVPWAQLMFGYLRMGKRNQHVAIINIVPKSATWKPFN